MDNAQSLELEVLPELDELLLPLDAVDLESLDFDSDFEPDPESEEPELESEPPDFESDPPSEGAPLPLPLFRLP